MTTISAMMLKCPRFKYLLHYKIKGVEQFRTMRNNILINYCIEVLKGNPPPLIDNERVRNEMEELNLDKNLEILKNRVKVKDEVMIKGEKGYLGIIDEKPTLFNLTVSRKWNLTYALSILYLHDNLEFLDDYEIATVMPIYRNKSKIIPNIRFYPRTGALTKSGYPRKFDAVGSWTSARLKIKTILNDYRSFIMNTNELPDPRFGECLYCPYHNVKIEIEGKKIRCIG